MFRRLFILAAVVSLGLPAVRAQEGAASHAAVIQADTLPALLERLERDPEDIDLLVEICSQYTMRSEFAAIHPYVSRLRRAGAAHDDERALMYADLFSGQSYLLAEGSDSTRIYLDRALIRGRQCEDPVALCRIYNALGIYAVSIETNYFGGIEYFLEAMEYARSASLNRFYLVAQCNLANTYYMRNDPAGLKYAEEVCRLGTEWGYDYLAFGGAVISAYMHYMLGDQDRALEYILRTLPDTDKFGYHTELYSLYANILHAQGDDAGAERYYLMALDHIDEKVVTAAVMTYLSYGTYLNDRGEYARAIPVLRQGIELSERSNNAVHRYKLYQRISEAETALGRYREALDYFKSYHSQADSIFNVEREAFDQRTAGQVRRRAAGKHAAQERNRPDPPAAPIPAAAVAAALRRRHFDRGLYPLPAQGQDVQADRPAAVRISEKGEKGRAAGHAPPTLFPRRLKSRRPTVTNTPCATPNSSPGSNT